MATVETIKMAREGQSETVALSEESFFLAAGYKREEGAEVVALEIPDAAEEPAAADPADEEPDH